MSETTAFGKLEDYLRTRLGASLPLVFRDSPFNPRSEDDMSPFPLGHSWAQIVSEGLGPPVSLGTAGERQTWEWRYALTVIVRAPAGEGDVDGRRGAETAGGFRDLFLPLLLGLDLVSGDGDEFLSFQAPFSGFEGEEGSDFRMDLRVMYTRQATVTRAMP